ncbi:hypothetical protein BV20DRAFT_1041470 [Pilatotrama ljubarskyi]|nr:hypothetical protein BV20DRAFT_1041470 [Pilatotrama ljubarskyi]
MARATRSAATTSTSNTVEKDKPVAADSPPTSRKGASKKRKRNSNTENGDSPPTKHARTDSKEDGSPELDAQPETQPEEKKEQVDLPSSGDVPIQSTDAASILEVLEMVDNQGLLDRVFPLPNESPKAEPSESSSTSPPTMLSFRSLLQNSSQYPLSILRAAVKHLYPISSHPRSRPSEPAAQQLRFCNLAVSLLDQASHHNAPVPLHVESLISDGGAGDVEDAAALSQASSSGLRPHKYALVQHLPTGDWWSSVSSTPPTADGEEKDLKNLYTAKADLVAIFPSASGSELAHKHTLGDYVANRPATKGHYKPPPPRRVSCGKFLYYGPYASFAPCFDQDGVEVGRVAMGEVIFQQEMKRRLKALAKGKRRAFAATSGAAQTADAAADVQEVPPESASGPSGKAVDVAKGLEALLPQEDVEAIKASLGTLEMEQAVDELLRRNARALQRLEELQLERFRAQGEGSSIVEVGSEEWDVAQGIIDSLALLASLRPRPSNGDPAESPLVPSPTILRKLQRTLPIGATEGWYGTLPEGRTTAFRDDTTVHVRSSATTAAKSTAAAAVAPAALATPAAKAPVAAAAATTPYSPYTYPSNYQSSQYRGGYGTYTPTQGSSYYPNYAATATSNAQTQPVSQTAAASHYPNAQYGAAAGQSVYSYSPWYGYQNQAGTASGRATPQPGQSTNYSSYYASGTGQRAVANTVMPSAKPSYATPAWASGAAGAGSYVAPTLPPHMRSAVAGAAATSGTPPPPPAGGYGGYYGGYQAPR